MSVENILQKLQTAPQFHPASADIFGDMTLDAGDVITVSSEGQSYDVPIYHRVMTWRGKPKTMITATGNQQREALPALRRREYAQGSSSYQQGKRLGAGIGGLDSRVSLMENSAVIQNSDSIALAAGKFVVDQDGNLHIINGTGLYLGEGSTSYGVYTEGNLTSGAIIQKINGTSQSGSILANKLDVKATDVAAWGAYTNNTLTGGILVQKINDGSTTTQILGSRVDVKATDLATWGVYTDNTLTAGIIVNKINGGTVQIAASKVDLGNYATVNQLEAVKGDITKLTTAQTIATSMRTLGLTVDNDLSLLGYTVDWSLCSIGSKTFNYLAPPGQAPTITYADLPHYHTVTFNNGQITIGGVTDTAPGPFDITATTWYKNQIAAAWTGAVGTVRINNSSSGAGDKTVNLNPGSSVTVYAQAKDNSGATVYTTYGTVTVNATTGTEWAAAVGTVRINNNSSGPGNQTVNLNPGGSVTVYAQAKSAPGATVYTTYGTVTVNAAGYTGLTVSGRTVTCSTSSTNTSATISAGTISVSESTTSAGFNTMSAPIYLDGEYIGTATGYAQVSSSQYKVVTPTANVSIDGSSQTVNLLPQTVYLTYTPPTPAYSTYTRSRQHSTWGYGDNSSFITRVYTKDGYIYTKDDPDLADDPTYYAPLSSREYWWYSDNGGGTWTRYGLLKAYITR